MASTSATESHGPVMALTFAISSGSEPGLASDLAWRVRNVLAMLKPTAKSRINIRRLYMSTPLVQTGAKGQTVCDRKSVGVVYQESSRLRKALMCGEFLGT